VGAPFVFAVRDRQRDDVAAWEADGAVGLRAEVGIDLRLHAPDDRAAQRRGIGWNAALKALWVEHLQECRVRAFVAVVRRRGKEEAVLDVGREKREQFRALRVGRVNTVAGWRALMHLVDD